eukprot:Nk52_evm39s229 gene=Nk52_evmTU39s229
MSAATGTGSSEEQLLFCSRHGDIEGVKRLLETKDSNGNLIDINCVGKGKGREGWTALHLACFFGHEDVATLLLVKGANPNCQNGFGDTPLHMAAHTGREGVLMLLLNNSGDVTITNGDGYIPEQVAKSKDVVRILKAALQAQRLETEGELLKACREGNIDCVLRLMNSYSPPSLECSDHRGNTPLHCASYRGHVDIVNYLVHKNVDKTKLNSVGKTAAEIAKNEGIRELIEKPPQRHYKPKLGVQGYLDKRVNSLFGWKKRYFVLEDCVLTFYRDEVDASSKHSPIGSLHLQMAIITIDETEPNIFSLDVNSNSHKLRASSKAECERWVENIESQRAYFSRYYVMSDEDKVPSPIDLDETLKEAASHRDMLTQQINQINNFIQHFKGKSLSSEQTGDSSNEIMEIFNEPLKESRNMLGSLNQCLEIVGQHERYFFKRLEEEKKRRHALEESLSILATEHNSLELKAKKKFSLGVLKQNENKANESEDEDEENESLFEDRERFFDAIEIKKKQVGQPSARGTRTLSVRTARSSIDTVGEYVDALSDFDGLDLDEKQQFRMSLPAPAIPRKNISVWSILKQSLGKDLSKVAMPVILNEPISFLQRLCEDLEYVELLQKASSCSDPIERLMYVSAFAISTYSTTQNRLGKPFNPLLGETYELVREDMDVKVLCEQVSHHPPISALHCEAGDFEFWEWGNIKNKFWGKSLEVIPEGAAHLKFKNNGHHFSWQKVTTCVHNIVYGELWIDNYGDMEICNQSTGDKCVIRFKPQGWFGKEGGVIEGSVMDGDGEIKFVLVGKWTESIAAFPVLRLDKGRGGKMIPVPDKDNPKILWRRKDSGLGEEMYNMTEFAVSLNDIACVDRGKLCPTDSRLRPDQRFLEEGNLDLAGDAKLQLEEAQRRRRKALIAEKKTYQPRWFIPYFDKQYKIDGWVMNGSAYWSTRERKEFPQDDMFQIEAKE